MIVDAPPVRRPENIADPVYRTKLVELPEIISDWVKEHIKLENSDILDFGCGEATTALGFALYTPVRRVVGVDIMSDLELCAPLAHKNLGLPNLPGNLSLHKVSPGSLHNSTEKFDLIYSWSVFEHIDQTILYNTVTMLHNTLKRGGLLFVQIAPLYYSSEGSHFYSEIPIRWAHLLMQDNLFRANLTSSASKYPGAISTYDTLNRLTAPALIELIRRAGFKILREYRTKEDFDIPPELLHVYREDALRTNQIVVLAQREE